MPEKNFDLEGLSDESFNEVDDSMGSGVGDGAETPVDVGGLRVSQKALNALVAAGFLVTPMYGCGAISVRAEKKSKEEAGNAQSTEQFEEPSQEVEEEFVFLDSSVGSGLDDDGLSRMEEVGEDLNVAKELSNVSPEVFQEITDIINEVNGQDLEERESSKLTVDAGLIYELSRMFPEIGLPNYVFAYSEGTVSDNNIETKNSIVSMNTSDLRKKFDISSEDLDEEAIMLVESGTEEGWEEETIIYGGDDLFYLIRAGDILSIVREPVGMGESSASDVQIAAVIGKKVVSGRVIIKVVYSDNETRLIHEVEVEKDNIKDVLGGKVFVTRKDWRNKAPEAYDITNWHEGYEVIREYKEPQDMAVINSGARMYSVPLAANGEWDYQGEVAEMILPINLRFNITETVTIKTPNNYVVILGILDETSEIWGLREKSFTILEVTSLGEDDMAKWHHYNSLSVCVGVEEGDDNTKHHFLKQGAIEDGRIEGWKEAGRFPFQVTNTFGVSEIKPVLELLNGLE
jgi:hypothetical protein